MLKLAILTVALLLLSTMTSQAAGKKIGYSAAKRKCLLENPQLQGKALQTCIKQKMSLKK